MDIEKEVDDAEKEKKPKQADILIGIALAGCELFHDADGTAYADVTIGGHRETWPIRRKGFRNWLARQFFDATAGAPNSEAVQAALGVIEATAVFKGEEHEIAVRVGGHDGRIYIDLCDSDWRAVEIDEDGWRVIDESPVRFCRTAGMRPLPEPKRGGSIEMLRPLINVKDDRDFILVVAWLLAALRPRGPYPIFAPMGAAGTAKSSLVRILRGLVDPNKAPLRSLSRDDRELFISAVNMWVLSFDNVSVLPQWLSDGLCRLATGGGHAARSLYTDSDEALFDAMRPIILNGIENFIVRGDAADRALVIPLAQIPENERRSEEELWAEVERRRPLILGALYDAISTGIKRLPTVNLPTMPRMADFARWGVAACPDIKTRDGTLSFIEAYAGNRAETVEAVLDADPVAVAIRDFMADRTEWQGIATDLLVQLNAIAGEKTTAAKDWPKDSTRLGGRLTRLATHLRVVGVDVHRERRQATGRKFTIRRQPEREGKTASPPSPPSPAKDINGLTVTVPVTLTPDTVTPSVTPSVTPNPLNPNGNDTGDTGDAKSRPHSGNGRPPDDTWHIPDFCDRRPERLGAPAISSGADDDLGDIQ